MEPRRRKTEDDLSPAGGLGRSGAYHRHNRFTVLSEISGAEPEHLRTKQNSDAELSRERQAKKYNKDTLLVKQRLSVLLTVLPFTTVSNYH
jgi:hypothetical protein